MLSDPRKLRTAQGYGYLVSWRDKMRINSEQQAREMAGVADGAVVGSALVDCVAQTLDGDGRATDRTVAAVTALAGELAAGVHTD